MVGFGAGYYLGARAGRARYEQIRATIARIKRSDSYEKASEKAKAVVDLTTERAKDLVEEHTPLGNGSPPPQMSSR